MNLFFRLLWTIIFSPRRSKVELFGICSTPFRVWLTDLDVLRHMNNGVYFSLQDLARVDYMYRNQSSPTIKANNWYPVVTAETLQFKKSLKLFQRFQIETEFLGWDDKNLFLEHRFMSNGEIIAQGFVQARFLKMAGGSVTPDELLQALNKTDSQPQLKPSLRLWLDSVKATGEELRSLNQAKKY